MNYARAGLYNAITDLSMQPHSNGGQLLTPHSAFSFVAAGLREVLLKTFG